jgi:hypothetical protein
MDYMGEIAVFALPYLVGDPDAIRRIEYGEVKLNIASVSNARRQIEELIQKNDEKENEKTHQKDGRENEPRNQRAIWAWGPAEARRELLTDLLYQYPALAGMLCKDLVGSYPGFLVEMAALYRERNRKPNWIRRFSTWLFKGPSVAAAKYATLASAPPPKDPSHDDPLVDQLLLDPQHVYEQAEELDMAVPFAFVLRRELEEVDLSAKRRSEEMLNFNAIAANYRGDADRLRSSARAEAIGESHKRELLAQATKLDEMVSHLEGAHHLQMQVWIREDKNAFEKRSDAIDGELLGMQSQLDEYRKIFKKEDQPHV